MLSELATVVRASPKCLAMFEKIQKVLSSGSPRLKPLCPTHWTVRSETLNAVLKNYKALCCQLEQLSHEGGKIACKACGLIALWTNFLYFSASTKPFGICSI